MRLYFYRFALAHKITVCKWPYLGGALYRKPFIMNTRIGHSTVTGRNADTVWCYHAWVYASLQYSGGG